VGKYYFISTFYFPELRIEKEKMEYIHKYTVSTKGKDEKRREKKK